MKLFFVFVSLILSPISIPKLSAQDAKPFVFTGYSYSYAYLGGHVGIGAGLHLGNRIEASFSVGKIATSKKNINVDVGLKGFLSQYFFIGINYGLVDYEKRSGDISRTYGTSLSIGGKLDLTEHVFISPFVGISMGLRMTDNFGFNSIKQFGILTGYAF